VTAHIERNDAVLHRKLLQLILPLCSLSPKAVQENKCPLGVIGRNIERRKSHLRICGNAKLMTVKVEVYVHAGSLHEAGMAVNFEKNERAHIDL
jgi:hypothetical protein